MLESLKPDVFDDSVYLEWKSQGAKCKYVKCCLSKVFAKTLISYKNVLKTMMNF